MKKEKIISTSKVWLPGLLKFVLCPVGESDKCMGPPIPTSQRHLCLYTFSFNFQGPMDLLKPIKTSTQKARCFGALLFSFLYSQTQLVESVHSVSL